MAKLKPSVTSGLMACILVLMLAMTTSSSNVHKRMASSSCKVLPAVVAREVIQPATSSGKCWRWYTGKLRRGINLFADALQDPAGVCTPPASATGPLKTQSGNGVLHSALPASISSLIICATLSQPASCHNSNGPCFIPKPQRMAKSMSRAVSATSCKCTAE